MQLSGFILLGIDFYVAFFLIPGGQVLNISFFFGFVRINLWMSLVGCIVPPSLSSSLVFTFNSYLILLFVASTNVSGFCFIVVIKRFD